MLINFSLAPVDDIEPWGDASELCLHWFGLSDGSYFLQAGTEQLLCYSDACQQRVAREWPELGNSPFVDYQVARLHQDLLEIAPLILDPIPQALARCAHSELNRAWLSDCQAWLDRQAASELSWNAYYHAIAWQGVRALDTGYLSPSANIWFWRIDDDIHIEWDNTDRVFQGVPAWAAQRGSYSMPVPSFLDELESFHQRFTQQMGARVQEVIASWARPGKRVDCGSLLTDQAHWGVPFQHLLRTTPPTDWKSVFTAMRQVCPSWIT